MQLVGQRLGIGHDLRGVVAELGTQRLAEGHGLGGDHMHQRPALNAGKDRRIDLLRDGLVIGQDHAAARAAQGLVGGGGRDMRMRERRGMRATRHQPGEMRHVHQEPGADGVGDGAEPREVDHAGYGRAARDDQLGLVLARKRLGLVIVDAVVLLRTPYCTALNHLPDWFGAAPWVRCPPEARFMPRIVSPGFQERMNTP
jgi:hypothetical protein